MYYVFFMVKASSFENFKDLAEETKMELLGKLLDFDIKPFNNKWIQDILMKIIKDESEHESVKLDALNVLLNAENDLSNFYLELLKNTNYSKGLRGNLVLPLSSKISENKEILEFFVKTLKNKEESDNVKQNIALALGSSGVPHTKDVINALITSYENKENYSGIRTNAITSLISFLDDPDVKKIFESSLKDPDSNIKSSLVEVLIDKGDLNLIPYLEILSNDSDNEIAQKAKEGIEFIKDLNL